MYNGLKGWGLGLVVAALVSVLPASNKATDPILKYGNLAIGMLAIAGGFHLYCSELKKEVLAEVKKLMDQSKGQG